jgi:hypothetical protein
VVVGLSLAGPLGGGGLLGGGGSGSGGGGCLGGGLAHDAGLFLIILGVAFVFILFMVVGVVVIV